MAVVCGECDNVVQATYPQVWSVHLTISVRRHWVH
jgi:hypothetical protein